MADVVTLANKESALQTSLENALVSDMFSYRLLANAPNSSRQIVHVSPQIAPSGDPAGKQLTFRIPRYGLIQRMLLKSTLTDDGDQTAADDTNLGLRVFETIDLRAASNTIASCDSDYLIARHHNSSAEMGMAISDISNDPTAFSSTSVTVYTPVPMWFSEKTSNYLDARFVEQLELQCVVNSKDNMGVDGLTGGTFELIVYYRDFSQEYRRSYEAKNFSPSSPLSILAYDMYTETEAISNGDTSTTITLKVPHLVFATHVFVRDTSVNLGPDNQVTQVTVAATGKKILENIESQVFTYDNGFYNVGGMTVTDASGETIDRAMDDNTVLTIYWGESSDRTYNSGAIAAANLNNYQITATHTDPGDANSILVVVHEYWKVLSVNPDDGRISSSFSL